MEARLDETERIVAELQSGVAPVTHTPVHVRDEPARDTVRVLGEVRRRRVLRLAANRRTGRLSVVLAGAGVEPAGPRGRARTAPRSSMTGPSPPRRSSPSRAPIALARRGTVHGGAAPACRIGEVPAARVAVLVHAGDYDSIGDTYRTLGAWVARNAEHAGERVREWYVVSSADTDDADAYRTEIAWPIRPPHGARA